MIDRDGFRSNVGIVLVNETNQVFWGRRVGRGGWQFPQGGMAEDETPRQAMYRELQEEVGLAEHDVQEIGRTKRWLRYRLPPKYRQASRQPRCIGQKQVWFLLRLRAEEAALNLDATDSPEFEDWRWVDFWTPPMEVIFFKRRVYERALKELEPMLFPEK